MNTQQNDSSRAIRPAVGVLMALVTFVGAAFAAPIVMGSSVEPSVDNEGPAGGRAVVASGSSKHFGPWELTSAHDSKGQQCVGVRFTDPPKAVPIMAEGCGAATSNQVGSIEAPENSSGTLFFGQVTGAASSVTVSQGGNAEKTDQLLSGRDGKKYVVTESDDRLGKAEVTLQDQRGRGLGRVDAAATDDE